MLTLEAGLGFILRHDKLAQAKTTLANVLEIKQRGHTRTRDGILP